jgi:oligopeptide/dipeptide ABC transporter ATP-binding protein
VLTVEGLSISARQRRGGGAPADASRVIVEGVNFDIRKGEAFGLIGETGAGKSLTAAAVMGILPSGVSATGRVLLNGRDVLGLDEKDMADVRRSDIFFMPQTASTSLNPAMTIGRQLQFGLKRAGEDNASRSALRIVLMGALERVGFDRPDYYLRRYPHQLSGGMRQRVVLAMALLAKPKLLIADEPTSALDVLTQVGVLDALHKLQRDEERTLLFITHDLRAAQRVCAEIGVMYGGRVVERGPINDVVRAPKHPYTALLMGSVPSIERRHWTVNPRLLEQPSSGVLSSAGCPFAERCDRKLGTCETEFPGESRVSDRHVIHCFNPMVPDAIETKMSNGHA